MNRSTFLLLLIKLKDNLVLSSDANRYEYLRIIVARAAVTGPRTLGEKHQKEILLASPWERDT